MTLERPNLMLGWNQRRKEMFDFIVNLFPCRVKSIEDFAQAVRSTGCVTVFAQPCHKARNSAETASVGVIADFQYILEFVATTPRGRKIVYRERLFDRFGSDSGGWDAALRRNIGIRHFLLSEQKVNELQAKFPDVSVKLLDPSCQPMDDTMLAKLHRDAATYNVSV